MDFFENRYYKISRFYMLLIGQWPYDHSRLKSFQRVFITFFVVSFTNAQIVKLLTTKFSLDLFLDIFTPLTISMMCYTKYVTCWYNADILMELLEQIKYDWNAITVSGELKVLQKYAEEGRIVVIIYLLFIHSAVAFFIGVQFLPDILDCLFPLNHSRPRKLPFEADYLVDHQEHYHSILIHMIIVVVVVLGIAASADFLFICIVLHACGIFSVLGYRLEHMFDDAMQNEKKYGGNGMWLLCERVANCVDYHRNAVKYVGVVNSCYANSSVVQLVLTLFILTSILLKMFENLSAMENMDEVFVCTLHVSGYIFLAFLNIFPAQKLLDCSGDIFYRTYFARWYAVPTKVQKLLLLIMQKGMEPCGLTAANILTSSMEIFATILQMSLSYFTVLYSVRQ